MAEPRRAKLGRTILGWVIVVAAIAAPAFYFFYWKEDILEVTAITLQRGHVEQTVSAIASGTVKAQLESMIAGSLLGKIAAIPVKEGDQVKKGDVLVELEHADLDAQVELAEANLRMGKSRFEQARIAANIYEELAKTRVSQAVAQFEVAKTDFQRIRALTDKKAVSQSDLDKVALALRVAQENDGAARASQRENEVRREEIKSAESAIEQLEAAVRVAKEMRDKALIRAPYDATVAKIPVNVGESVAMGMPLLKIVQQSGYYVKAPFDEANMALIKPGQEARVSVDTYRGEVFPGKVDFISPIVSLNMDLSRTLDINVNIEKGQEKLISGMSADVVLLVDKKDDVLSVPSEALIREETAYVVERGRAVKRDVKIGIGNVLNKEVLDGLKEGDTLITSVTLKGLLDGVKVRVVDALKD